MSTTKITEVVERALRDPVFAEELKTKAIKAAKAGSKSNEFSDLMYQFAEGPDDLSRMMGKGDEEIHLTTTTVLTTTTTSTGACTITTTTTTATTTGG
ncbi:hypothetical protein [Streptomyces sp. NPDC059909]|uniref:hypothetical protein n=1 Tax=Streptomyces sp. NPDC059909 TaxID=3346998 RepID=UPI00365A72BF